MKVLLVSAFCALFLTLFGAAFLTIAANAEAASVCTWADSERPFFAANIQTIDGEPRIVFRGRSCKRSGCAFLGTYARADNGEIFEITRLDHHRPTTFGEGCWLTPGASIRLPDGTATLTVIAAHSGYLAPTILSPVWRFRYSGDPSAPGLDLLPTAD